MFLCLRVLMDLFTLIDFVQSFSGFGCLRDKNRMKFNISLRLLSDFRVTRMRWPGVNQQRREKIARRAI